MMTKFGIIWRLILIILVDIGIFYTLISWIINGVINEAPIALIVILTFLLIYGVAKSISFIKALNRM